MGLGRSRFPTLVIFGFESEDCFVSYVRRVLVAAVNLEDVFLYSGLKCRSCKEKKLVRYPWTEWQRISLSERLNTGIESGAILHYGEMRPGHLAKMEYPECSMLKAKKGFA